MSDKTQLVNIQKYLCEQPIDIINDDDGEYYLSTESALELAQQILDICQPQWMDFNKLELQAEDLECAHLHLDDLNIPRHDSTDKEYSIVGRINVAIRLIRSLNEDTA